MTYSYYFQYHRLYLCILCILDGITGNFIFINAWNEWGEGMAIEPSNLFGASMLDAIKATKEILEKRYKDRGNKDYCMKAHNLDSTLAKLDYVDVSTIFEADSNY